MNSMSSMTVILLGGGNVPTTVGKPGFPKWRRRWNRGAVRDQTHHTRTSPASTSIPCDRCTDGLASDSGMDVSGNGEATVHGSKPVVYRWLLTNKRRIHLRSASVRTYTFFTTGFPRFLSIRRARGLQAFDLPLLTNYSNPNYD
jgi:hypothetical protein